jgi:hypothetical protein
MAHQLVHLLERALVEQRVDALARGQLAFLVLPVAPFLAAARFRCGVAAAKFCNPIR